MFKFALLAVLASLGACATTRPCDFAPSQAGWRLVDPVPEQLIEAAGHRGPWYVNDNGEYFACVGRQRRNLCGGNYMIYVPSSAGFTRKDDVVCTAMRVPPNNSFKPTPLRGAA
jgi:hypothetical protein